MNAVEFVKKYGWDRARSASKMHIADFSRCFDLPMSLLIDIRDDLKRLVDSWELAQIHGLENSKKIVANAPSDEHFYSWTLGNSGVKDKTVNIGELRKAIADVESVGGGV